MIGPDDVVVVKDKALYKKVGNDYERFFMRGIAFPVPLDDDYHAKSWIGILHQLHDLGLDYNTIRVYSMDPELDYSEFFNAAAELGVYVMVPLTASKGGGVLDRSLVAPACYHNSSLFDYGVSSLQNFLQYPNVIAGTIANEVMNSLESWAAAPCIKAYARDLKNYMEEQSKKHAKDTEHRYHLPLVYAAQHSAMGAAVNEVEAMKLTVDYLTCIPGDNFDPQGDHYLDTSIDIFGVNVESWCSSQGTFLTNEDGTQGSYNTLWKGLHNSTVPLIYSEMGCSHLDFNHDNGLTKSTRDWKQVPVVLDEMSDTWSGFCAYAYDGNALFNMFEPFPWHGREPLKPTQDFYNFRDEMEKAATSMHPKPVASIPPDSYVSCSNIRKVLESKSGISLPDHTTLPSYHSKIEIGAPIHYVPPKFKKSADNADEDIDESVVEPKKHFDFMLVAACLIIAGVVAASIYRRRRRQRRVMRQGGVQGSPENALLLENRNGTYESVN